MAKPRTETSSSGYHRVEPGKDTQAVSRKLGVMFLGTHTGDQPWDIATTPRRHHRRHVDHALLGREHPGRLFKRDTVFGRRGDELGLSAAELRDVPGLGRRLPHGSLGGRCLGGSTRAPAQGCHRQGSGAGQSGGDVRKHQLRPEPHGRGLVPLRQQRPSRGCQLRVLATARSASFRAPSTAPSMPS